MIEKPPLLFEIRCYLLFYSVFRRNNALLGFV
jgi:hypothetical protein